MWNMSEHIRISDKFSDNPKDVEAFINQNLINKIEDIKLFTENEEEKARVSKFFEDANTSRIAQIFENATLDDILPVCYIAVRRFPSEYVTVLLDYILKTEGGK